MSSRDFDYNQLGEKFRERARSKGDPSVAALANHESALAGFLRERGIDPDEPIGSTLRELFLRHLASHLDTLRDHNADRRYLANRKSSLKRWRTFLAELDLLDAALTGHPAPFTQELRRPFDEGATRKGTARTIAMPLATLVRWLNGAMPTRRSIHYVDRIERLFGMTPGHLRGLLPGFDRASEKAKSEASNSTKKKKSHPPLMVTKEGVTEPFKTEWTAYKDYKTQSFVWEDEGEIPEQIINIGDPWRLVEMPPGKKVSYPWIHVVGNGFSGTARHEFGVACLFLGWLQLAKEYGGLGLTNEDAQHLGHFADVRKVRSYVFWRKKNNQGVYTRTTIKFLSLASVLCRPPTGFMIRNPDLGRAVGVTDSNTWEQKCAQTLAFIAVMRRDINSKLVVSDRGKQLEGPLAHKNPIQAFGDAIKRHKASKDKSRGKLEHIWARDLVMLYLTVSCPLRLRNLQELSHTAADAGTPNKFGRLRRTAAGEWLIEIPRAVLKNGTHKAALEAYVVKSAWGFLDRYFRDYRPLFGKSSYVFASRKSDAGPWEYLSQRFRVVTGRNLEGRTGIGTQAARHLVATGLARQSGSSDSAATALHDSKRTVDEHYILDAPRRAAEVLDRLLNGGS